MGLSCHKNTLENRLREALQPISLCVEFLTVQIFEWNTTEIRFGKIGFLYESLNKNVKL